MTIAIQIKNMQRYCSSRFRSFKYSLRNKCNMFLFLASIFTIVFKLTQIVVNGVSLTTHLEDGATKDGPVTTSVPSTLADNGVIMPRAVDNSVSLSTHLEDGTTKADGPVTTNVPSTLAGDGVIVPRAVDNSMAPVVKPVTEPVWLGEGPHWDHDEQALYFVSIFDHTIDKYVPETGKHTKAKTNGQPTFIIPIEGQKHHFVVGLDRRLVEIQWDGQENNAKEMRTLTEVDQDRPKNRFNDAKADPRGRLFAGTMGSEYEPGKLDLKQGSLYRFDENATAFKLRTDIDISNGLCWDVKEKAFYYADSYEYNIKRYDYDLETGNISNPRIVFSLTEYGLEGIVDGITIDTDGNLWAANFDGHQVLKIDPRTSKLVQKVAIPALQTTSLAWGGPALDELYVTSAAMNRSHDQLPPAGATFRVTGLSAKGHPSVKVKLNYYK